MSEHEAVDDGRSQEDVEIADELEEELKEVIAGHDFRHVVPAVSWVFSEVIVQACDGDAEKVKAMFAGLGKAAAENITLFLGRTYH